MASPEGASPEIQAKVNIPAILLMVTGALILLTSCFSIIRNIINMAAGTAGAAIQQPGIDAKDAQVIAMFSGVGGIIMAVLGIVFAGLIAFGGYKMKNLQGYGLAMTAAIIAVLPCNGCCCLSIPVGIYALIVLMDAQVKASFS